MKTPGINQDSFGEESYLQFGKEPVNSVGVVASPLHVLWCNSDYPTANVQALSKMHPPRTYNHFLLLVSAAYVATVEKQLPPFYTLLPDVQFTD